MRPGRRAVYCSRCPLFRASECTQFGVDRPRDGGDTGGRVLACGRALGTTSDFQTRLQDAYPCCTEPSESPEHSASCFEPAGRDARAGEPDEPGGRRCNEIAS